MNREIYWIINLVLPILIFLFLGFILFSSKKFKKTFGEGDIYKKTFAILARAFLTVFIAVMSFIVIGVIGFLADIYLT